MKFIKYLIFASFLLGSAVWAGDVEDADAALTKKDYTTALKKFKSAAAKGNAYAQTQVGNMYNSGQGVVQDYAEAMHWYKLATAQGLADAQRNLGFMYDKGEGVLRDDAEAAKWHRLAAAQGDAVAQLALAMKYSFGHGVLEDYVRAHMWVNLAAAQGNANAVVFRKYVADKMTPQQIADAQKLARECQARNFKNCD